MQQRERQATRGDEKISLPPSSSLFSLPSSHASTPPLSTEPPFPPNPWRRSPLPCPAFPPYAASASFPARASPPFQGAPASS